MDSIISLFHRGGTEHAEKLYSFEFLALSRQPATLLPFTFPFLIPILKSG